MSESDSTAVGTEPCPSCQSRDNLTRYSDGHGYCFGCKYYEHASTGDGQGLDGEGMAGQVQPTAGNEGTVSPVHGVRRRSPLAHLQAGEFGPLLTRRLQADTLRKFDYRLNDPYHYATFYDAKGNAVAQKRRGRDKKFSWIGDPKNAVLFGQQCWAPGGKKVVVTEGEIDAMSMSQVQGNKWPTVSLKDGAASAEKSIRGSIEWLSSFDEIVLMFDMDEPGQQAARRCAEILPPGRVSIAQLPLKDANEMLVAGREKELLDAMWRAKPYRPDGIVMGLEVWTELQKPDPVRGASLPFAQLDAAILGLRLGEVVTFCAGTGVGKSTACREIAYHLIRSGDKVGYIALEESFKQTAKALMSIHLERKLHIDPMEPTDSRFVEAFEAVIGEDKVAFYDHWGSTDPELLLSKIRYLATGLGCKWIFLDHISIMVSGIDSDDNERVLLDRAMTHLGSLVRELNVGLVLVCHLSKPKSGVKAFEEGGQVRLSDLRGTAGVAQLSDTVVALERNQQAKGAVLSKVRVLKCRFTGYTGLAGELKWDNKRGRLEDVERAVFTGGPEGDTDEQFEGAADSDAEVCEPDDF